MKTGRLDVRPVINGNDPREGHKADYAELVTCSHVLHEIGYLEDWANYLGCGTLTKGGDSPGVAQNSRGPERSA